MSIKIETFLALEASLSKRLRKSLKKLTTELYQKIDTLISSGDFEEATRLINTLSLSKVIEDNQDYIAYLTNMAMLFGASRVTPNPGTSVVGMGYERTIAEQAVRSFAQTIINGGEKQLRKTGLQLIAQAKLDAQVQVQKKNPYHDELGRFTTREGAANGQEARAGQGAGQEAPEAGRVPTLQNLGADASGDARTLSRNYRRGVGVHGTLNGQPVDYVEYEPTDFMKGACSDRGIDCPTYKELTGDNAAKAFMVAMEKAKQANPSGASVYMYSEDDYKDMRLFVTENGTGGIAVKPDGDIVSVFNTPGTTRGMVFTALQLAVGNGGRKLDCFDTKLPVLYSNAGFTAQSRIKWDDSQAPSDWNKETYKAFNNGEPDVVFMTYDPKRTADKPYSSSEGTVVDSYDDAVSLQQSKIYKADRKRVLRPFSTFMGQSGESFFDLASSLHTSRLSAYGFTAEADALGYTEYQINEQLDSRTCPVCAEMHGKVFKVSDARSLLDIVLRIDNPDDLKSLQPWPKQDKASVEAIRGMSPAELVSNHWHIPPFHPRCRGLLVRVDKAPTLEQIASNAIPENYVATREDFKALGASFNQGAVDTWNKYSSISPLEFAARLQGTTADELMGRLLQSKKAAISGILGMSGGKNIGIRMERAGFGTKLPFYQHIQIKPEYNALYINAVELDAVDQGSGMMKKYMQSLVSITRDMGLPAIRMTAGLDVGGYAWAKYGFVPTQSSWDSLVKTISTKITQENLLDGIPEVTASAVSKVLASGDPMNIFVLSDLVDVTKSGVPLGKALLMGTTWDGSLLLDNAEHMARFLTYIGGTK